VNYFDLIVLILLVLFVLRGALNGLASEFSGLLGLIGGLWCAHYAYQDFAPYFADLIRDPFWRDLAAYALILLAVLLLVDLLARVASWALALTLPPLLDKILGAVLGLARGVAVCAVCLALLYYFLPDAPFFRDSFVAAKLDPLVKFARGYLPSGLV